jgi:hypothetical protein
MIEVGPETIAYETNGSAGCALIVGAVGTTENKTSTYRIKGFIGDNKLKVNEPIFKSVEQR